MSRTNGHQVQPGARPQAAGHGSEADPRGWQQAQAGAGQAAAQAQPYPQQPYPYAQGPAYGQAYGQPPAPYVQGVSDAYYQHAGQQYQQPAPQQPAAVPQTAYQPAYEAAPSAQAHVQPQPAATQPGQGYYQQYQTAQQGYGQPAAYAPPEQQAPPASQLATGLRGTTHEQWSAASQPSLDPRSYDLSSYQHPQSQPQPQTSPPAYGYPPAQAATDWQVAQPQFAPQGQYPSEAPYNPQPGGPSLDPSGFGPQPVEGEAGEGYEEEYYEEEAEPKGRSWLQIAAVLAAAVVVGGGAMYSYNAVFGGRASDEPTPVVKAMGGPAKVKPQDPGGAKFDHADSKIMGRLADNSGAASGSSSASDAGGSKKVSTVVVNPDGSIQPPSAEPAPAASVAPQPQSASAALPGLSIVNVGGEGHDSAPAAAPAQKAADPGPAAAVATGGSAPATSPQKPVIISKVQPTDGTTGSTGSAADAAAPASAKKVAVVKPDDRPAVETNSVQPKPAEKKVAAATPAAAAPVSSPKPTGAGYVAVLASVPASATSQLDALKQFADLKAKYASLLGSKTPEVQVATVTGKGTYHRLIAGPPGSQESVKELCSGLKAAGYAGCWPLAY